MGARGSKTKPNADAPLSRRGSQTLIVAMDSTKEYEDEVRAPEKIDGRRSPGDEVHQENAAKVSKVQEILEGKVVLKKNHQQLEQLPKLSLHAATLDLQFSSSEDSDDDSGRKRRKGAKKKRKKSKGSIGETVKPAAPVPSPVKLKLSEIKTTKKPTPPTQSTAPVPVKKEYFEQISDAYNLTEYAGKEADDGSPKRQAHQPQHQQQMAEEPPGNLQPQPPPKPQQQPSPSSSPSKYFGGAFDNWKKPTISIRSNRSQIMETRDASRKSSPHSNPSNKSNSSRAGDRSTNSKLFTSNQPGEDCDESDLWQSDIDEMERESTHLVDSFSMMSTRSRTIDTNPSVVPTPVTATPLSRPKSNRRNLSIDDTDESIMDTILAEVAAR